MRVTVDVKRAGQDYNLDTMTQQNYLVFEFAGVEVKVPCTEEQLGAAIRECMAQSPTVPAPESAPQPVLHAAPATTREFSFTEEWTAPDETSEAPVTPAMFVVPESQPVAVPPPVAPAATLRPVARKPTTRQADDAGISQG